MFCWLDDVAGSEGNIRGWWNSKFIREDDSMKSLPVWESVATDCVDIDGWADCIGTESGGSDYAYMKISMEKQMICREVKKLGKMWQEGVQIGAKQPVLLLLLPSIRALRLRRFSRAAPRSSWGVRTRDARRHGRPRASGEREELPTRSILLILTIAILGHEDHLRMEVTK